MPTPADQRLARIQREVDRAKSSAPSDGLATCAGMDSQGRVLVEQGGVVRPLSEYQSNAGAVRGQAIEVSDRVGVIAPRSKTDRREEVRRSQRISWWAVSRVDTGSNWQYWAGGDSFAPTIFATAPKQVPGCPTNFYLFASWGISGIYTGTAIVPCTAAQLALIDAARGPFGYINFCTLLGILGLDSLILPPDPMIRDPASTGEASLGQGVGGGFSVTPNAGGGVGSFYSPIVTAATPCGSAQANVFFDASEQLSPTTNQFGYRGEAEVVPVGGGVRVFARGRRHSITVYEFSTIDVLSSQEIIASTTVPATSSRGSAPSVTIAIKDKLPYFRLQHTPQCSTASTPLYSVTESYSIEGGQLLQSQFPSFPANQYGTTETPFGTDSAYFDAVSGGIPQSFGIGSFPTSIQKRKRGQPFPGETISSFSGQARQPWQWPGVIQTIGYIF